MSGSLGLSRRESTALGSIVLASLALRLVWLQFEFAITPDGYYYATLGERLVSGDWRGGLSLYWPPVYPLLVGIFSRLFGDLELGGRMVSVVLGSLLVVPAFLLYRNVAGRPAAYVGASLLAFHPELLRGSTKLLSDVPFTFLFVTAVLLGLVALSEGRGRLLFWVGLLFGAAYLTRPEAFGLFGLFVAVAAVVVHRARVWGGRRRWVGLLALAAGFAVLALPYVSYLRVETGRWTISTKLGAHFLHGGFNWRDLMPGGELTYADRYYADVRAAATRAGSPPASGEGGGRGPRERVARVAGEMWREYTRVLPAVFPPAVLILVGVGIFAGARSRQRTWRELYVLGFVLATLLGYGLIVVHPRYLMPVVPLVYLWVAGGLVEVGRRLRGLRAGARGARPAPSEGVILAVLVLALGATMLKEITYPVRRGRWAQAYEMRMAGQWIEAGPVAEPVILANSPVVAFYAGARHCYYTPNGSVEALIAHAGRLAADYLVVDERKILERGLGSQRALLERPGGVRGLRLVYRFDEVPGARVRVFALTREDGAEGEMVTGIEAAAPGLR